jgi:hypothetical protein
MTRKPRISIDFQYTHIFCDDDRDKENLYEATTDDMANFQAYVFEDEGKPNMGFLIGSESSYKYIAAHLDSAVEIKALRDFCNLALAMYTDKPEE